LDVLGFDVFGFDVFGFDVFGASMSGLEVLGLEVLGLDVFGFDKFGFDVFGFDVFGLEVLGFDRFGLYTSTVAMSVPAGAPSGLTGGGTSESAFSTTKLDRLSFPDGVVSVTFTVIVAVLVLETAKTGRAMPECAGMATSSTVVSGDGGVGGPAGGVGPGLFLPAVNDANPLVGEPGGWFAIVSRKLFSKFVKFCTTTTKALCSVVLRGLEFSGEDTSSP